MIDEEQTQFSVTPPYVLMPAEGGEVVYSPDELSTPKLATLIIGNTLIKIHATSV